MGLFGTGHKSGWVGLKYYLLKISCYATNGETWSSFLFTFLSLFHQFLLYQDTNSLDLYETLYVILIKIILILIISAKFAAPDLLEINII